MSKETKNIIVPELRFAEFKDCGIWKETNLQNVCQMQAGKFVSASDITEIKNDYLFPCYGGNGLRGYTKSFTHTGKYSLIGRQGALCGNVTIADGQFHATEHAVVVTPKKDVDTLWLFYMLNYLNLNLYATGQAQPGLSVDNLKKLEIKISCIENEQKKIASCLSSLDDLITAESQQLKAFKAHKKGLMQQLFPAEGETVPRLRFGEFKGWGDWEAKKLGEIGAITSGGTPNRSNAEYWNGNIPWVSTTLINFNIIKTTNEFITEAGLKNSSAKLFPRNTILMAMYGQGKTRGKVAILEIEAATNQACAAILLKDYYNTNLVFQNLAGRYEEIRELSNQGGQENLSGGLIENIPIKIPTNPKEQQKIADCLSSLDELITAQGAKIEALKAHKKGLMQGLFPGNV